MRTYLVVVEKGASAQSLRFGLLNLVSEHKGIELVLLHTPNRLPNNASEEARTAAVESVAALWGQLVSMGLPVIDARVGDAPPGKAIAAEMTAARHTYDGIVLTSKAPGLLRALQFDRAHQLERKYHVPVVSIDPEALAATTAVRTAGGSRQ